MPQLERFLSFASNFKCLIGRDSVDFGNWLSLLKEASTQKGTASAGRGFAGFKAGVFNRELAP